MNIPEIVIQSRFKETKEFMCRLWRGEIRGALAYVVPSPADVMPSTCEFKSDYYPEKFLYGVLNSLASRRWGHDYAVPMIQSISYGGGVMATAYGSQYNEIYNYTASCIHSADQIDSLNLNPTLTDGLLGKALDLIRYVVDQTKGQIPIQMYNAGGPMDIASMVLWDKELLTALYTHPKKVHQLLDSCTELYIAFYKAQQQIIPEFVPVLSDDMYVPDGHGILCGEDWLSVISPDLALEFEIPYINRISDAFKGVAIHACGNLAYQFENLKKNVCNLRGIYFNAGECSFQSAVDTFRGTDVVLMPRWALNHPYTCKSRLDFVKKLLAMKTDDVNVYLIASYSAHPELMDKDPYGMAEDIIKYIEQYNEKKQYNCEQ